MSAHQYLLANRAWLLLTPLGHLALEVDAVIFEHLLQYSQETPTIAVAVHLSLGGDERQRLVFVQTLAGIIVCYTAVEANEVLHSEEGSRTLVGINPRTALRCLSVHLEAQRVELRHSLIEFCSILRTTDSVHSTLQRAI